MTVFGWVFLALFFAPFICFFADLEMRARRERREERERAKGEVLAARWAVIEAAEDVIHTADEFNIGMPHELRDTIERLRAAVAKEGAR